MRGEVIDLLINEYQIDLGTDLLVIKRIQHHNVPSLLWFWVRLITGSFIPGVSINQNLSTHHLANITVIFTKAVY